MTYKPTNYIHDGRSYPSWVGNEPKQRTIFRFLSAMGDHYNKSLPQIKKSFGIYRVKLQKIPFEFIQEHLGVFLASNMGLNLGENQDYRFSPSPALIYEFLRARPEFNKRWEIADSGKFCSSCKTSDDSKEGGFRQIYMRYIENDQTHTRDYIGLCDCQATKDAKNLTGATYTKIISFFEHKYTDIEIFFSYYCEVSHRLITSKEQSSETWERRINAGYVIADDSSYYPDWNHIYWRSNIGLALAEMLCWEMPEGMREEIAAEVLRAKMGDGVKARWAIQSRSRKDGRVSAPKSISSLL